MPYTRSFLLAAAAAALIAGGAQASDLLIGGLDPVYNSPLFNFEGFYAGASLGIGSFPSTGTVGVVGVVAGTNFTVTDAILAGVEFQGDLLWNDSGVAGIDALFLAKLGFYLTDQTLLYGTAGVGWVADDVAYGLGAGVEQAITDQVSVRGEALATGAWGGGFDGGKATVSVLWHMN